MMSSTSGRWTGAAVVALTLAIQGCGGSGSGSGGQAAPIAVVPTPVPTTTPTPVPVVTPTPASPTTGPFLAGASQNQQVEGPTICLGGAWRFDARGSAAPGLSANVAILSQQFFLFTFEQSDVDTYTFGFDRFTAGSPSTKLVPETTVYDQFFNQEFSEVGEEVGIYRDASPKEYPWSALGYSASPSNYCSFAVGLPSRDFPVLLTPYIGLVDGIAGSGNQARRLFNSGAIVNFDFPKGTGSIMLELRQRDNAFGNFLAAPTKPIDIVTGNLVAGANGTFTGQLTSASGRFSGSVLGQMFGPRAHDVGIAFELRDGAGMVIGGAAILTGASGTNDWA